MNTTVTATISKAETIVTRQICQRGQLSWIEYYVYPSADNSYINTICNNPYCIEERNFSVPYLFSYPGRDREFVQGYLKYMRRVINKQPYSFAVIVNDECTKNNSFMTLPKFGGGTVDIAVEIYDYLIARRVETVFVNKDIDNPSVSPSNRRSYLERRYAPEYAKIGFKTIPNGILGNDEGILMTYMDDKLFNRVSQKIYSLL